METMVTRGLQRLRGAARQPVSARRIRFWAMYLVQFRIEEEK